MDVYPLEKPGEGMKNYSKYLRKQHDEILMLLNDSCPFVRIIAIKVLQKKKKKNREKVHN